MYTIISFEVSYKLQRRNTYKNNCMMNDGAQPNEEWVTLLSSTNNRKITQRGRYLEVNIYEIVN